MTSEPMMPIGRSRCGFFGLLRGGGHDVEADVGKKNTREAPDTMPSTPKAVGVKPSAHSMSGCCRAPLASAGCDGGMNGL